MFNRIFQRKVTNKDAALAALRSLMAEVEKKNIPVIADDQDAGYDMAIDEVLVLIQEAINKIISDNDVDYSGGI